MIQNAAFDFNFSSAAKLRCLTSSVHARRQVVALCESACPLEDKASHSIQQAREQLCRGDASVVEYAIHLSRTIFERCIGGAGLEVSATQMCFHLLLGRPLYPCLDDSGSAQLARHSKHARYIQLYKVSPPMS